MDDEDLDLNEENKEPAFIKLENVHKTYLLGIEGIAALRGVDLEVKEGEFLMICGTSGGGKSTMLNIMGTIDKPTKGRVTVCKKIITPRTSDDELAKIRLENLGFVFQTFNLLSSMTAVENVELPLTFLGYGSSRRKELATQLLQMVQMGDRLNHYPTMLSGGEQQRVTIARAMANAPGLLLLDEPTGDLDSLNTNNIMRLLVNLNQKGTTLVMVTHDMNLVPFGTRVVFMRDGKVHGGRFNSEEDRAAKIAELEEQISMGRDGSKSTDALGIGRPCSPPSARNQPGMAPTSPSAVFPHPQYSSSSSSSSYAYSNPQEQAMAEEAARQNGTVIPRCTSIREPGDYDPIAMADPSLTSRVGYDVSVRIFPQITPIRPYAENPYSNIRKAIVAANPKKRRVGGPGPYNSGEDERPGTDSSKHSQNSQGSQNLPYGSPQQPPMFHPGMPSPTQTPASFPASFPLPTPSPGYQGGGYQGGGYQGGGYQGGYQ